MAEVDLDISDEEAAYSSTSDTDSDSEVDISPTADLNDTWFEANSSTDQRSDDQFYGLHGLNPKYVSDAACDEIFFTNLCLPDSLYQDLVNWTNIRARMFLSANPLTDKSRCKNWTDVTVSEMKKTFACLLLMGIVKKPTVASYWSTSDLNKESYKESYTNLFF